MKPLKKMLNELLESAKVLGLSDVDLKNAKEFLIYNEYELCFDIIITQMYEYDIEINNSFYDLIEKIGVKMKLPQEKFSFLKELITNENDISELVKEKIAKIIKSIEDSL